MLLLYILYYNHCNVLVQMCLSLYHRGVFRYVRIKNILTRCTRGVRVVFSVTRMRSSNSARINKFDFRTEKSCSVHMTVFEIVAGHNVVNWMQLLT